MMSNKGLNSNEALEESTATNSSVTLSGIRREKETPTDLDIKNYRLDPGNSDPWEQPEDGRQRTDGKRSEARSLKWQVDGGSAFVSRMQDYGVTSSTASLATASPSRGERCRA